MPQAHEFRCFWSERRGSGRQKSKLRSHVPAAAGRTRRGGGGWVDSDVIEVGASCKGC